MKKTNPVLGIISILILTLISFPIISVESSNQTIIYVDDDNVEGPWDGSSDHPFQFIQDGIDAAEISDTVYVCNGTYQENLRILKKITLKGEQTQHTIIDGMLNGNAVTILHDNVTISGFSIINTTSPPYVFNNYGIVVKDSSNCSIYNNDISYTAGVSISDSVDTKIFDNTMQRNDKGINVLRSMNTSISNNALYHNSCSITLRHAKGTLISQNNISDNSIAVDIGEESSFNCIKNNTLVDSWSLGVILSSPNNIIIDNWMGNNSGADINLKHTLNTTIARNVFYTNGIIFSGDKLEEWISHSILENIVNGKPLRYYKNTKDIQVPSNTGQLIIANCSNVTIQNLSAAIQLGFSHHINITSNTINDTYYQEAISLSHSSNIAVINNTISNSGFAIRSTYSPFSTIRENKILNASLGIAISDASNNVIEENMVKFSGHGIGLWSSINNSIETNEVRHNEVGMILSSSVKNTIIDNRIRDNAYNGIYMQESSNNAVIGNTFENNAVGFVLYYSNENCIRLNNFIANTNQAWFFSSFDNDWLNNYWDDWVGFGPKIIFGYYQNFIPWLNLDWRPAAEPYIC